MTVSTRAIDFRTTLLRASEGRGGSMSVNDASSKCSTLSALAAAPGQGADVHQTGARPNVHMPGEYGYEGEEAEVAPSRTQRAAFSNPLRECI
mmetsp:Transcript_20453/g.41585  ORF Transcript_20453/g.41585 Transcript_20453/m.41585 type:complete len:93 (-) Transcript_20453:603-881(-)